MFPPSPTSAPAFDPFLCLRRGVSSSKRRSAVSVSFSLPTQRCFQPIVPALLRDFLFSAYAEVFPGNRSCAEFRDAFLCLRRGVSRTDPHRYLNRYFSLPTQRCFPRTNWTGSIGKAFLCLRRGVSVPTETSHPLAIFSLPTQRCFLMLSLLTSRLSLFSAYAEVFPAGPG